MEEPGKARSKDFSVGSVVKQAKPRFFGPSVLRMTRSVQLVILSASEGSRFILISLLSKSNLRAKGNRRRKIE